MAVIRNLENPIYVGADDVIHFTVYDTDGVTPLNVTGYTTQFKLLKADAVVLTVAGSVISGAAGTIDVTIASADTSSFKAGEYEYVFRRTGSGTKTVYGEGTIQLKETVSWA